MASGGFAVDLVAPRVTRDLHLMADEHSLILSDGLTEERFDLDGLSVRERRGSQLVFVADSLEFALDVIDSHPLDALDYVLDARARARGLSVPATRPPRPWPDPAAPNDATQIEEPRPTLVGVPLTGGKRRRSRVRTALRWLVATAIGVGVAVAFGAVVGNVIDEMSGPGVGSAVEIEGALVVRDVAGTGPQMLPPFTAAGPWTLEWENLGSGDGGLSVTLVSMIDRSETRLLVAEPAGRGSLGPIASGRYRLVIEARGDWRFVIAVDRPTG